MITDQDVARYQRDLGSRFFKTAEETTHPLMQH